AASTRRAASAGGPAGAGGTAAGPASDHRSLATGGV
ncbi:MAG: hypothetical protein AVDCRST_MAG77-4222, partial [uncultured Chloroflexi bacterium]